MSENKIDKLEDIKNIALLDAIKEMKDKKTKEAEASFISELKKANLITPANIDVNAEDGKQRINFILLSNDKGDVYLPAFTSMDELKLWRKDEKTQAVVCKLEQYIGIILSNPNGPKGLVIDAFGENILLSRQFLLGLVHTTPSQDK